MERARELGAVAKEALPEEAPSAAPDAAARADVKVAASPLRCPYCHDDIAPDADDWVVCKSCLARHHSSCWREGKKCATCGNEACLRAIGSAASGKPRRTMYSVLRDRGVLPGEKAGQTTYATLASVTGSIVWASFRFDFLWGLTAIPFVWIAILLVALRQKEKDEALLREIVKHERERRRS